MTFSICTRPRPRIILVSQSDISSRFVLILYRLVIGGLGVMVGFDMDFGTPNKKPPMVPAKNAAPDANQSKENVRRPDRRSDSAVSPYKSSLPQPSATDHRKPLPAHVASPKIPLIALRSRDSQEGGRSDVPFSVICLSPKLPTRW